MLTPGFKMSYLPSLWLSLLFTMSLPTYGESELKMINADVMKTLTEVIPPKGDHPPFFSSSKKKLSWNWDRSFTIIWPYLATTAHTIGPHHGPKQKWTFNSHRELIHVPFR